MSVIGFLALWLATGLIAGFFAGSLGIGGGIVVVPTLFWTYKLLGDLPTLAMQKAIASSLCIMVFTSFASATAHYFKKGILFSVLKWIFAGALVGAFLGAFTSNYSDANTLKKLIACLQIAIAALLIFKPKINYEKEDQLHPPKLKRISLILLGIFVAFIAALLGIGGGIFLVPIFMLMGYSPQQSVGTSTASIVLLSLIGAGWYFFVSTEMGHKSLHDIINLKAILFVAAGSLIGSPLGAIICYKLSGKVLRAIFASVLLVAGFFLLI